MRVGLTYDLRDDYLAEGYSEEETAELDRADTIDAIEAALRSLGHATDRIGHGRQLVARLAAGDRWDLVFNLAEGLAGSGREALVPALLDLYAIPYTFSDPLVLALTLDKAMTKRVVRDLGLATPAFVVAASPEDLAAVSLPLPLFVKPLAEGTSKGISARSRITEPDALAQVGGELLARFRQPVLVETYLPGRELTVGILGTGAEARVAGVLEVELLPAAEPEVYTYANKERCEELVSYRLAADDLGQAAADLALAVWRGLGCRDAGRVDVRADAFGRPQFMEINPLAGLHPQHSDLPIMCTLAGVSYPELIAAIMTSAGRRLPEATPRVRP
ncbi:MAG: D-alanine--D-alanine ligase [Thermodesulfobacteriota bacterium]